eukprot:4267431-Alexandrium_andersonii.AAC.1
MEAPGGAGCLLGLAGCLDVGSRRRTGGGPGGCAGWRGSVCHGGPAGPAGPVAGPRGGAALDLSYLPAWQLPLLPRARGHPRSGPLAG